MARVTHHDTEPATEAAEFLLPTTPGGRKRTSGPNCEAPAAGPMTFIKADGGGKK